MDVKEAYIDIKSTDTNVRLRSARFFSNNPSAVDPETIRQALLQETVPWIRKALTRALDQAEVSVIRQTGEPDASDGEAHTRVVRTIMARAAEEVTGTILHEFGSVIGSINLKAISEFEAFEDSQTYKLMTRLNELLKAIRNLKKASASPAYSEFSLSELTEEILQTYVDLTQNINIQIAGPKPFLVTADRGSLLLAIVNGLRNASEAVKLFSHKNPAEILMTWGRAGSEVYFAIIDSGSGFKGIPSDALRIGVSSKENHTGFGLATAQYAMRAMEGDLVVSNSLEGGARFELRWYKDNESTFS